MAKRVPKNDTDAPAEEQAQSEPTQAENDRIVALEQQLAAQSAQMAQLMEMINQQQVVNDAARDDFESLGGDWSKTEEKARAILREQTTGGKYKYRVRHRVTAYNDGNNKDAHRLWASEWTSQPFSCDEPDPRKAKAIYMKLTRCRLRDDTQLQLYRVDDDACAVKL